MLTPRFTVNVFLSSYYKLTPSFVQSRSKVRKTKKKTLISGVVVARTHSLTPASLKV